MWDFAGSVNKQLLSHAERESSPSRMVQSASLSGRRSVRRLAQEVVSGRVLGVLIRVGGEECRLAREFRLAAELAKASRSMKVPWLLECPDSVSHKAVAALSKSADLERALTFSTHMCGFGARWHRPSFVVF